MRKFASIGLLMISITAGASHGMIRPEDAHRMRLGEPAREIEGKRPETNTRPRPEGDEGFRERRERRVGPMDDRGAMGRGEREDRRREGPGAQRRPDRDVKKMDGDRPQPRMDHPRAIRNHRDGGKRGPEHRVERFREARRDGGHERFERGEHRGPRIEREGRGAPGHRFDSAQGDRGRGERGIRDGGPLRGHGKRGEMGRHDSRREMPSYQELHRFWKKHHAERSGARREGMDGPRGSERRDRKDGPGPQRGPRGPRPMAD